MAVFSNVIQQKRVLDAGQLFPSSHVWNDRPVFTENFYRVKGRLFQPNQFQPNRFQKKSNSVPLIGQKNIFLPNQRDGIRPLLELVR